MINSQSPSKSCLHELVKYVFSHSTTTLKGITYSDLAERIGRLNKHGKGHGHGMGNVLGKMGYLLNNLEGEWGEPIPPIQSLVVNKSSLLPDDGIKEFWQDYPNLSKQEKLNKVAVEYIRITNFGSRWNKVLSALNLPTIHRNSQKENPLQNKYGRGGESPQHLALKKYVSINPKLVGANVTSEAFVEYPLPSLDILDILFKYSNRWVAVEVKSSVSDKNKHDYERGLYQCIKYGAIFEAMKVDNNYNVPKDVHTVLLLETRLPQKYKQTAEELGIEIIEGINIPGKQT